MRNFTLPIKKFFWFLLLFAILMLAHVAKVMAQTTGAFTTWTGNSTNWNSNASWTNGVPNSTTTAIINGTAITDPEITGSVSCYDLIIQNGSVTITSPNSQLTVHGSVQIKSGATLVNEGLLLVVRGNFVNGGDYSEILYKYRGSNYFPAVELSGTAQEIQGNTTSFSKLTVAQASTVILKTNISMEPAINTTGTNITVNGKLQPGTFKVIQANTTSDAFVLAATGWIQVMTQNFTGNYGRFPSTINQGGTIEYGGVDQYIVAAIHDNILLSGSGTKYLLGNTTVYSDYAQGNVIVRTGVTLDLGTYTLNRSANGSFVGGELRLEGTSKLLIGNNDNANNFPAGSPGFRAVTLGANSTVVYYGSGNQIVANPAYGNLMLTGSGIKTLPAAAMSIGGNFESNGSATFTARGNINVTGNVLLEGTSVFTGSTSGNNFIHTIGGNWTNNATFTGVSSTVRMNNGGKEIAGSSTTSSFHNLFINGNINITASVIDVKGTLQTISTSALTQNVGGTVRLSGASNSIIAGGVDGIKFQNLVVTGAATTASSFIVNEDLTVNTGGSFNATASRITFADNTLEDNDIVNSGTLSLFETRFQGKIGSVSSFSIKSDVTGSGRFTATGGTVTFDGTSTLNNAHDFNNIIINGTHLRLAGSATLGVAGDFTLTSGAFDATFNTPNTVVYNGAASQDVLAATYHNITFTNAGAKTAVGALTVNGNLTINSDATFNAQTHTHTINGNWKNDGIFNHGNGIVAFRGTSNTTITGATTFNQLTINKTSEGVSVTLANADANTAILNMELGELRTGTHRVNVTNTRNGNGWVVGTIRRTHAFAAGQVYAFNGPHTQLHFATVNGVNDVSFTSIEANISDFPSGAAINRSYNILANGDYTGARLQLQYKQSELAGNPEDATLQLYKKIDDAWRAMGRDGNSAVENWVRKNDVQDPPSEPNVNGLWTLSATVSVFQWVGTYSDKWEVLGNWEDITTLPAKPANKYPGAIDIVELGGNDFNFHPTIRANEEVKGIRFWGVEGLNLTLGTGGNLTVGGNIAASGSRSSTSTTDIVHTITVGDNNLTIGGNLTLNDGSAGNNLNITLGTGIINVEGSLDHRGNSTIDLGSGKFNLGGDFLSADNTRFTRGTGEFVYKGSNSQNIGAVTYHHLTIDKTAGVATLNSNQANTIYGNLTVKSGSLAIPEGAHSIMGRITHSGGAFLTGSSEITVHSTWTKEPLADFDAQTSTVIFAGTTAQSIPATTFNNLTINRGNITLPVTLAGNVSVKSTLSIANGLVELGNNTINRSAQGGNFYLLGNSTLTLTGSNFPALYNNNTIDATTTVRYIGTDAQDIRPVAYGNLELINGGTNAKRLMNATEVRGNLKIGGSASLNGNEQTLTLRGHFTNGGSFNPGPYAEDGKTAPNGRVVLASTGGVEKLFSGNPISINNLLVEKNSRYRFETGVTIQGDLEINGISNVDPTSGVFDYTNNGSLHAGANNVSVAGNFRNQGILRSNGEAKFMGTREQLIQLLAPIVPGDGGKAPTVEFAGFVPPVLNSSASPTFGSVTISNIGGVTTSQPWTALGSFVVMSDAKFHGGGFTHTFGTAFTNYGDVTSSGVINFLPQDLKQESSPGVLMTEFPFTFRATQASSFVSTGTLTFGSGKQIKLQGVSSGKLNNLVIATTLAPIVTVITPSWDIQGDMTIMPTAVFNGADGHNFRIGGNLINNGTFNATGSDVELRALRTEGTEPVTIIPSVISGSGAFAFRNLKISEKAKARLESNITLSGNLQHEGTELNALTAEVNFTGTGASTINATVEGKINLGYLKVSKTDAGKVTLGANVEDLVNVQVLSGELDLTNKDLVRNAIFEESSLVSELKVSDGATLRAGKLGTTSQLQLDKFTFEPTSTVEYYGGTAYADIQAVLSEQYGHLKLSNISTKTFNAGHAKIAGNFTIENEAKVVTPQTIEYNGSMAQAVAAIDYKDLMLSNTGAKVLASGVTGVSGALTRSGTAAFDAITNNTTVNYNGALAQSVFPDKYYNLALSNIGNKSFTGTTSIANAFDIVDITKTDLSADNTIDFNGSVTQAIPGLNYKNLSVSGSGTKNLTGNAHIEDKLSFVTSLNDDMLLNTTNYEIVLAELAQLEGEVNARRIVGTIKTTRPVLTGDPTDFGGIGIEIMPQVNAGLSTMTRITGMAGVQDGNSVARTFRFEPEMGKGKFNATIAASYFSAELNSSHVESELQLLGSIGPGFGWYAISEAEDLDMDFQKITTSEVNNINYLTFSSSRTQPLPVELIYFKAVKSGNLAVLTWETASEQNNQGFEVQVSSDGKNYQNIGFVESKGGTSSVKRSYTYADTRNGKTGMQYYRLRQVDYDGTYKFYGPRTVSFGTVANTSIVAFPNPFTDKVRLSISAVQAGKAKLTLRNIAGQELMKQEQMVETGSSELEVKLSEVLPQGLYLLTVELDGIMQTIKLIKR